jgi:SsrA-binding protein
MEKGSAGQQRQIKNKKARYHYEVLEKIECGIALRGTEVKSIRAGRASLDEAFGRIVDGEVLLLGCHIDPYSHAGPNVNHDPRRPKKLLLRRAEIKKLSPKVVLRGQTLVPLSLYFNDRGLAKVSLALVRGKSHRDKRQELKSKQHQRDMARAMRR